MHYPVRKTPGLRAILVAAVFGLAACGGDDGAFSQPGLAPPGPTSTPTPTPSGSPGGALSSPDIIFTSDSSDSGPQSPVSRQQLFTIHADGTGRTKLSDDGLNRFLPHFSPDGRLVVYIKFFRGGYGSADVLTDVVVYDRAANSETRLTNLGNGWQGAWSPDGKRIVFGTNDGKNLSLMNADGTSQSRLGGPSGAPDDLEWGDWLWSSDGWIYFVVKQNVAGCFKARIDRIRPDGSMRTQITDGGPHCTPEGLEQSGDSDPGISPDGRWLYSSRGLPRSVPGFPDLTVRHLYRISTDPFVQGKVEENLSTSDNEDCIAGVPKVSPGGTRIALFQICPSEPGNAGIVIMNTDGKGAAYLTRGFGPDWHPDVPF